MKRALWILMFFVAGTLLGISDSQRGQAASEASSLLRYRVTMATTAFAGGSCSKGCSCPSVQCKKSSSNACATSCREDETPNCSCQAYCDNEGYVRKYQSCSCE